MKFSFDKMGILALAAFARFSGATPINEARSLSLPNNTSGINPVVPLPLTHLKNLNRGSRDVSKINRRDEIGPVTPSGLPQYYGGAVIGNIAVTPIFWGPNGEWKDSQLRENLTNFISEYVQSPYIDNLAQYSTNTTTIGRGTCNTAVTLDENIPNGPLNALGTQIIEEAIKKGAPAPDNNSFYAVLAPKGFLSSGDFSLHTALVDGPYTGTKIGFFPYPSEDTTCILNNQTIYNNIARALGFEIVNGIVDSNSTGWHVPSTDKNWNNKTDSGARDIMDACNLPGVPAGQMYNGSLVPLYADRDGKCFSLPGYPLQNLTYVCDKTAKGAGWSARKIGGAAGGGAAGIVLLAGAAAAARYHTKKGASGLAADENAPHAGDGRPGAFPLEATQGTPTISHAALAPSPVASRDPRQNIVPGQNPQNPTRTFRNSAPSSR